MDIATGLHPMLRHVRVTNSKRGAVVGPVCRLTRAMQRTGKSVTQIASAIFAPLFPAADRRR
jgi:hypothetical protein